MKKYKVLLIVLLTFILLPLKAFAASGTVKVTGNSSVVVGNKITLTVTLSSQTLIGSWQMILNYDKSHLQLVSTTAESDGTKMANSSANGTKTKSYTYTFKALKTGTTSVAVSSYLAYAYTDFGELSLSASNKNVKIMTQAELEASYSKDNDLKYLAVEGYTISPEFAKDVLEYSVTVPENTNSINIKATANDSKSSITGAGVREVNAGANSFDIVVRAENGSEKLYKLSVLVQDSNPIEVQIDGSTYNVVKIKEYLVPLDGYEESSITIKGFDIPAYYSDITKKTLVGLKDLSGNISYYIYENDNYYKYIQFNLDKINFYPIDTDKTLKNYNKGVINILKENVTAYYKNENDRLVILYGININNSEEGFFIYDKNTNSLVKYDESLINIYNDYEAKIDLYSYIIIGFSGILVIMFILLIKKNKGNKKPKKEEK